MSRPALQVLPSPATADDLMLPGHGNTVLSCLLNQPAATEELYDLSRDDFIAPTQKIIFDAIADVHGAGTPVNILSVTDRLRAKGQLEQVGGAAQLTSISLEPYTPGIVQYALTELRDASKERQAAKIGEQLQNREIQARQAIERLEKLDEGTVGDFPVIALACSSPPARWYLSITQAWEAGMALAPANQQDFNLQEGEMAGLLAARRRVGRLPFT